MVLVEDQAKAHKFFCEKLGFITKEDVLDGLNRWLVIASSKMASTGLILTKALPQDLHLVGKQAGSSVFMILETDDFDQSYQSMCQQGVIFEESPRVETYGKVVIFSDLYGNKWDLIQKS